MDSQHSTTCNGFIDIWRVHRIMPPPPGPLMSLQPNIRLLADCCCLHQVAVALNAARKAKQEVYIECCPTNVVDDMTFRHRAAAALCQRGYAKCWGQLEQ